MFIKYRSNKKRIIGKLKTGWKTFVDKDMRGVMSKFGNAARDQAKRNAVGVGLGRAGPAVTPGGWEYLRKGQIPGAIYSYVMPNRGTTISARATVDTRNWALMKGAVFTEYGGRFNPPRPYLIRAGRESLAAGMAEAERRMDQGAQRILD